MQNTHTLFLNILLASAISFIRTSLLGLGSNNLPSECHQLAAGPQECPVPPPVMSSSRQCQGYDPRVSKLCQRGPLGAGNAVHLRQLLITAPRRTPEH